MKKVILKDCTKEELEDFILKNKHAYEAYESYSSFTERWGWFDKTINDSFSEGCIAMWSRSDIGEKTRCKILDKIIEFFPLERPLPADQKYPIGTYFIHRDGWVGKIEYSYSHRFDGDNYNTNDDNDHHNQYAVQRYYDGNKWGSYSWVSLDEIQEILK